MWVAGKRLSVSTSEGRYEDRQIGDPVPEAPTWPLRQFQAHKSLGWIEFVEPTKSQVKQKKKAKKKSKRRKVVNVVTEG